MKRPLLGGPLLCALAFTPALAQPVKVGPEFQVNTFTNDFQGYPAMAASSAGDFVVVWQSVGQEGIGNLGIFGQRFDIDGVPQGGEFHANTFTPFAQSDPAVGMDANGDFVVVWQAGLGHDGSGAGVFGQRFDSDGNPVDSEFPVNTYTTSFQGRPAVAVDDDGDFVVVWQSDGPDGSGYGIFGRRFDSSGVAQGNEFQINAYTTGDQKRPQVASEDGGDFVVAWQSNEQDGSGYGIFAQRFSSAGGFLGGELPANSYTTGAQAFPDVAMDSDGDFVVVWQSDGQDGSNEGIFGQRYDSGGAADGAEFQINQFFILPQTNPSVGMDASGGFVVAWQSIDGSDDGIFARSLFNDGTPETDEFQVSSFTTSGQTVPAVAMAGADRFVVSWSSVSQDGSQEGVYAQRFADGACVPTPEEATDLFLQWTGGLTDLLATWTDSANSESYRVYEDSVPSGSFTTLTGTAPDGATGLVFTPGASTRYYIVRGFTADCGLGP
jgi:hypothetical protein